MYENTMNCRTMTQPKVDLKWKLKCFWNSYAYALCLGFWKDKMILVLHKDHDIHKILCSCSALVSWIQSWKISNKWKVFHQSIIYFLLKMVDFSWFSCLPRFPVNVSSEGRRGHGAGCSSRAGPRAVAGPRYYYTTLIGGSELRSVSPSHILTYYL